MNQDKLTHKSDFLLATLRVYMFSPLATWVGVVSFLYLLYTVTRFDSQSQAVQREKNRNNSI